ncbi:RecF/RecN/SMC N terminal domain-containing protein, partial [Toxoplasma gondii CAST]
LAEVERELDKQLSLREEAEVAVVRQEERCRLALSVLRETEEEVEEGRRQRKLGREQRRAHLQARKAFWTRAKLAREEKKSRRSESSQTVSTVRPETCLDLDEGGRNPPFSAAEKDSLVPSCPLGWRSELYNFPPSAKPPLSSFSSSFSSSASFDLEAMHREFGNLFRRGALDSLPVGPVGEFLFVLRDACRAAGAPPETVAALVERHLRPQVFTWVVGTKRDQRVLLEVFREKNLPRIPRVVVVNPDAPPYPDRLLRAPAGSVFSIYRALCLPPRGEEGERGQGQSAEKSSLSAAFSPSLRLLNRTQGGEAARHSGASRDARASEEAAQQTARLPHQILRVLVDACRIEAIALVPSHQHLVALLLDPSRSLGASRDVGSLYAHAQQTHFREGYDWTGGRHLKRSFAGSESMPQDGCGGAGRRNSTRFVRLLGDAVASRETDGERAAPRREKDGEGKRDREKDEEEEREERELRRLQKEDEEMQATEAREEKAEKEALLQARTKVEEAQQELKRRKVEAQAAENAEEVERLRGRKQGLVVEDVRLRQAISSAREALKEAEEELQELRAIRQRLRRAAASASLLAEAEVKSRLDSLRETVEEKKRNVQRLLEETRNLEKQTLDTRRRLDENAREIEALEKRQKSLEKVGGARGTDIFL